MINPLKWHRSILVSVLAFIVLVGAVLGSQTLDVMRQHAKLRARTTPSSAELEVLLYRLGFDPESLAAAGLVAEEVRLLVEGVVDAVVADGRSVGILDRLQANLSREFRQLNKRIRSGQATELEIGEYQDRLRDQMQSSQLQEWYLDRLEAGGQERLKVEQIAILQNLRESTIWNLPLELRVVRRSEEEWIQLRSALVLERKARNNGEVLEIKAFTTIATARADKAVRQAKENLADPHATEMREAFRSAIESIGNNG